MNFTISPPLQVVAVYFLVELVQTHKVRPHQAPEENGRVEAYKRHPASNFQPRTHLAVFGVENLAVAVHGIVDHQGHHAPDGNACHQITVVLRHDLPDAPPCYSRLQSNSKANHNCPLPPVKGR